VGEFDFLHDIQEMISAARHALPVLDPQGSLVGTISRSDLQASPKRRVILIDHFESSQAVVGIQHAEILEIIDHHRVGDLETSGPVRVECRPLGSSSTIVALRYFETNLKLDRATAVLLLGGLVSDTLCLRSPTTTAIDHDVAARLSKIIGVGTEEFGREVLRAGDDLLFADPAKIWKRDQKFFSVRNQAFAVAQLETVSLEELPQDRLEAFQEQLSADFSKGTHLVSLLFLTDVLTGDSWIASRESVLALGVVESCFGTTQPRPGWTLAKGVVSRKKQIVPRLLRALAEVRR
jgi:manganese-dependent inorganic pyrophosphatase